MSSRESLPGFIFDVQAWRGSNAIKRMSMAERGVYLEMLLEQWQKRFLPDDPQTVAEAIATTDEQAAEVLAAWTAVRRKFVLARNGEQRLYNIALERTRRKQHAKFVSKSDAGRKAGKASAAKRKQQREIPVNDRSTTVQRSSTDKGSVVEVSEVKGSREEITARSKRPIFTGQRLTVFEWQLDNCMKTLGPLTDDFDLHGWFADLDELAARTNLVIPRRDGGQWLEARLLEEVHRRGLPIAQAPQASKLTNRMASMIANSRLS